MYRALTWYFINKGISPDDITLIGHTLPEISLGFERVNGSNRILLNGILLDDELRSNEVSAMVSNYAVIPELRYKLVELQQQIAAAGGVVMDGRDIGTVVMPDADLKVFVTCADDVRVQRRYDELIARNIDVSYDEVRENLIERDRIDSSREVAPLKKADDAMVLDNSLLSRCQQLEIILQKCHEILT